MVTNTCCLRSMVERMAALISGIQLEHKEGSCLAAWDTYRLFGPQLKWFPSRTPPKSSTKRLVTAKFTGVTSTVSLTSNSPVYSGYSCYQHLIIVLCEVPLVLLPLDSASFTHADSEDRIQKNVAPAAGQETPAVILTET